MTNNLETVAEREPSKPSRLANSLKHIFVPFYSFGKVEDYLYEERETQHPWINQFSGTLFCLDIAKIGAYAYGLYKVGEAIFR